MPRVFGIEALQEAIAPFNGGTDEAMAFHLHAALKSAVRAVTPGRQQRTNLDPIMQQAQKAFIRTLKRRDR